MYDNCDTQSQKLAKRLAGILFLFNSGKSLTVKELANEFNVTCRTIQKDLNVRMTNLPIKKSKDNRYQLESYYLGKFKLEDIELFSSICGLSGLFPELNQNLILRLLHSYTNEAYLIVSHNYESIEHKREDFYRLEDFILRRKKINFEYKNKSYQSMSPYKLVSQGGIWYLAALTSEDKLKSFYFHDMKRISDTGKIYDYKITINKKIEETDSIWFEEGIEQQKITVKIEKEIVPFFKRRKVFPKQKIIRDNLDGSIVIETSTGNISSLFHKILYWIPNVHVLKPDSFREEVLEVLETYIKKYDINKGGSNVI